MKIEEVLEVVDKYLPQQHLNHVQELVLCTSWEGKSYQECAKANGYTPEYIKAVGYKLWKLLSSAFGEPVTKNELHSVLRRHSLLIQAELLNNQTKICAEQLTLIQQSKIAQNEADEPPFIKANQNWGEAVDVSVFYGRTEELGILEEWIVQQHCRLIGVFGMGGIGKTALSCKLAKQIQEEFEYVFWRSLLHTPPLEELLEDLIFFLSNQQETEAQLPKTIEGRISRLIKYLRDSRCLIVLDNVEAILNNRNYAGNYRKGYEGYGELFKRIGEVGHQSTLVLTSQEKPREVELFEGERLPVRSILLSGLKQAEGQAIFEDKGTFLGSQDEWKLVVNHYGGNPLALKMVASSIQELFDSNLSEFINFLKQGTLVFDDIRDLLNRQFERLSDLEQSVMYWITINREPVSLQELRDDLLSSKEKQKLPEALRSLERRSFIEKNSSNFTQQPVVMQYVTERFIDQICDEIAAEDINLAQSHALIKPQAQDYVKESQVSEILLPLTEQLLTLNNNHQNIEYKLNRIFLKLREKFSKSQDYGSENIINLIRQIKISLPHLNDSNLINYRSEKWNINVHPIKLNQANLIQPIFAQTLDMNLSRTFSQKEKYSNDICQQKISMVFGG